jgi:hypothetical protein
MKLLTYQSILTVAWIARPSVAYPQKPASKTLDELAPFIKVQSVRDDKPVIRPSAKRQLLRFGPWDLPAAKVSE